MTFVACNQDPFLPGNPAKRLVKDARRALWRFGIRPTRTIAWCATWEWAAKVAHAPLMRTDWPCGSEIAAQYVYLLLHEMKADKALKLPFRAAANIPEAIRDLFPTAAKRLALSHYQPGETR